jgi:hypothetical protein
LFGVDRQVYYRNKARDVKIIELVEAIGLQIPKIGVRNLYLLLQKGLNQLKVGRDMLFRIIKANHMLINPSKDFFAGIYLIKWVPNNLYRLLRTSQNFILTFLLFAITLLDQHLFL